MGSFHEVLKNHLQSSLPKPLASSLLSLVKTGVELRVVAADEEDINLGVSKIGGLPDLPEGFLWPKWKDQALSFIAQINVSDLQSYSHKSCLPETGIIYFFYSAEQETWGFDPNDKGSWAVLYGRSTANLIRAVAPDDLPEYAVYPPCILRPIEVFTYPPVDSREVRLLDLADKEVESYVSFLEKEEGSRESCHQLFGYPLAVQGDMQLECQLVSHGLYCGDLSGYQSPKAKELEQGTSDWQLLLQIDSDDNSEMMWGDCGRLYFWITKGALAEKRFDLAWMVLQCS